MTVLSFFTDNIHYFKFLIAVVLGLAMVSLIARLIFGKKSTLNRSVACSLGILCIYAAHIIAYCAGLRLDGILTSLPWVSLDGDKLALFHFGNAGLTSICEQILDMLILSLVMVVADHLIPRGKKLLSWLSFRIGSVALTIVAHYFLRLLLVRIIPQGILTYAPAVLVILLLAALLLGMLKLLIGGALAFLSPILAVLYAFFFKNIIGKQIRKAILTTTILSGLVMLLNYLGITAILLGSGLLLPYLSVLLIALILWYLISRFFE